MRAIKPYLPQIAQKRDKLTIFSPVVLQEPHELGRDDLGNIGVDGGNIRNVPNIFESFFDKDLTAPCFEVDVLHHKSCHGLLGRLQFRNDPKAAGE